MTKKPEGADNATEIANSLSGGDFKRPSDYRRMSIVIQRSKESKSKTDVTTAKSGTDVVGDKTVTKDDLVTDMDGLSEIIAW